MDQSLKSGYLHTACELLQIRSAMAATILAIGFIAAPGFAQSIDNHESGVDLAIKPGDDFFAYANGEWLKATEIPAGKNRWNARNEIDVKTQAQLTSLFAEATSKSMPPYSRKVLDFRAAYLDEAAIEAKGIGPIKPLLNRVASVRDKVALSRLLGSELRADVDPLNWGVYASSRVFGLAVQRGIHGEKNHFAYLLQGGLGLPDRDRYFNDSAESQALRVNYQIYVARILQLAGFDRSVQRAHAVMALETAIAKVHATDEESSQEKNADRRWSRAEFSSQAPGIDWGAFFAAAGLTEQQEFVVWQPNAIKGEAALIASQSLDAWQDYLRFHIVDRYVDVLPRAFADAAFTFRGTQLTGSLKQIPREQRALEVTNVVLSEAVGHMYVDKYFSAQSKLKLQAVAANVVAAFEKRIEAVQWMSPTAKSQARAKLKTLYFGVGYPEKWEDYGTLSVDAHDAIGNLRRIEDWNYRHALAKLHQIARFDDWVMPPQKVAAILMTIQNAYNFPAALLQPPKFDPAASDAEIYGSIGAIIGHEVSHFVDTLGADYNAAGGTQRWWTAEDLSRYQAASQPLILQFGNYRPFPDLPIDGKLTLSENIADLGGLAAAFDAYRLSLGVRAQDKQFLRQQDRRFFIAFARSWRSKWNTEALRAQVATNDHAPESYRISTVRNINAWYDAFDVLPGQKLYLETKDRVRIW